MPAPDIALTSGAFWGRNPHDELAWLRANAPVLLGRGRRVWGITRYDDVKAVSKNPADVLQRRRHPARHRPDPDDDRHGRPGAPAAPQARQQGLHAATGARAARTASASVVRRHDRPTSASRATCDFVWDIAAWLPADR